MSRTKKTNLDKTDPWLAWCKPSQGENVRRFLDNSAERLGMSVEDHLALMEKFFPSKTLHSAEYTISKAAKEATIPKLEAIQVANTLDIECDDTRISAPALMPRLPLFDVVDKVFAKLEEIKKAWPHPAAVERLKTVAKDFVRLLLAVQGLGKEKIAQAKADGRTDAVKKLEKAYKDFCMIDLTGDIDKDAEQLFLVKKITSDAFRAAMRRAFKLDREATDEINGVGNATLTPKPQQVSTGYTEADRKRDEETHAFVSNLKPKQVERQNAARLINEIYHSDELAAYAKSKGKKRTSRQFAISHIRHDILKKSKFYARAVAVRNSVLELAKSSRQEDIDAVWNSILTMAKKTDPQKGRQKHTEDYYEDQYENRYGEDSRTPRIVPNIGDASSDR